MTDKMDIWQSLGLQGNYCTLPDQSSSYSIIVSDDIASFPPLIFCHRIGSRQSFENIVASDSPLSEMIYFRTADDLFWSRWRLVDDVHWWTFLLFFYMTWWFSHMTHSISILASSFSPLLFILLKWSFIHSLNDLEKMKETSNSYAFTLHALVRIEKSY